MNLDWLLAPQYLSWLWRGFLLTLWLSACASLAATLLGFVLTAMRDSRLRAAALAGGGLQLVVSQYAVAGAAVLLVFRRRADPAFCRHAVAQHFTSNRSA